MGGWLRWTASLAAAGGLVLASFSPALAASFTDLGGYSWAANSIDQLSSQGVVSGMGAGQYDPSGTLTQEAAITMLMHVVAAGQSASGNPGGGAGGNVSSWALPWVSLAVAKGVIQSNDNFQALSPASRVQTIVWLVRALGMANEAKYANTSSLTFNDASEIPNADLGSVALAVGAGLISGEGNGDLAPLAPVNRAQMAVILSKAEEYVVLHTTPATGTVKEHNSIVSAQGIGSSDLVNPRASLSIGSMAAGGGEVIGVSGNNDTYVNLPTQPVGSGTPFVVALSSRTSDVSGQELGQWDASLSGDGAPSLSADGHLNLTATGGNVSGTYSDGGNFSGTLAVNITNVQPEVTKGSGTYQETDNLASGGTLTENVQFTYTDTNGTLAATWTRSFSSGLTLSGGYTGPVLPLPVLFGAADLTVQGVAAAEAAI